MSIVPTTRLEKIEFYESHIDPWEAGPTKIGLTAAQVTALATLTTQARAAYNAAEAARQASKAATLNYYERVRAMHSGPGAGSDMIELIKNYADTTDNAQVYVDAQIPAPATPGVTPPPGTPFEFTVGLLQNGAVELKWKCNNPSGTSGTIYEVKRRIGSAASAPFTFVGATGVRSFTDETIPGGGGSSPCTYQVTAVRSTARGNPAQFTVSFGIGGGGGAGGNFAITGVSADDGTKVKLAA
jgi:hypothetical protein